MKPWPPELGARTVILYTARARLLRTQARSEIVMRILAAAVRYAVAPVSAASKSGYRFCVRLRSLF